MAHQRSPEMIQRLEESSRRFDLLTDQLTVPEIISNREQFLKLSKERSQLEKVVNLFREYRHDLNSYDGARSMFDTESDAELRAMANGEVAELEPKLEKTAEELQFLLLPKDPNDEKNIVLEIRAGVGGDEAGIFAGDLYGMYKKYAESQKCRVELMSIVENSSGGFKEIIALIEGERVYSMLKYESGVHRVQRVPKTEAQGRIHTSTVTIAVLPEAEEIDVKIDPNELRIDVFRAGGHGGQSVNTTNSAVRITHVPTNEVVICQDEKSQLKNKNKAMKVLLSRLFEKQQAASDNAMATARRAQVGSGFRNERIRTYNYPQGRVTDHRIGLTSYNVEEVIGGKIQPFIDALHHHYQLIALKGEGAVSVVHTDDD